MEKLYNIYVLKNDAGFIKIGITTNFDKRLQSLSGSNGGGHKIIDYYISPETYLYTLERIMHGIYNDYRVDGTEWFDFTKTSISFNDVVDKLKELMNSDSYIRCNNIRKVFYETNIRK